MKILAALLAAGASSLILAGAAAAHPLPHTVTLRLPDGMTEQIHYAGDTEPTITLLPNRADFAAFDSPFWGFGPNSPFAAMARISATMDRQAAALLSEAQAMASAPLAIDMTSLPPGATGETFIATLSPNGSCRESMEIITARPGHAPRVTERRSGACGGAESAVAVPDRSPAQAPTRLMPETFSASAHGTPYMQMARNAAWRAE